MSAAPTGGDKAPVDPRYAEALRKQKAERKQMSARRRPILRLVWVNPELPEKDAS